MIGERPELKLTKRQREVWERIALGRMNKTIAHELGIGEPTVKHHIHLLCEIAGVSNRVKLALLYYGIRVDE